MHGIESGYCLHARLFPHQEAATRFLLRAGRGAAFLDTGLGKTAISISWADAVARHTGAPVLILAPLAVGHQFVAEGVPLGIAVNRAHSSDDVVGGPGIYVSNYDRLHLFDPSVFGGVVLDESSILKNFSGATRNALVDSFAATPFRLCATATPSPNDYMELGNHAAFLGVMSMNEMLQRFFINDTSTASQDWRLKKHAERSFWDWICSWSYSLTKPSDVGFCDDGFVLPHLSVHEHIINVDLSSCEDTLFRMPKLSATGIHAEGRITARSRADELARIIDSGDHNEPWLVWVYTDYDADAVMSALPHAVEVRGNMTESEKEARLIGFVSGSVRILVTKPRIAGWGMNFQHCRNVAFMGVSYSYEQWYQAVRRCWRFGQTRQVNVHVVMAATESAMWRAVGAKGDGHGRMKDELALAMARNHGADSSTRKPYVADRSVEVPEWLK